MGDNILDMLRILPSRGTGATKNIESSKANPSGSVLIECCNYDLLRSRGLVCSLSDRRGSRNSAKKHHRIQAETDDTMSRRGCYLWEAPEQIKEGAGPPSNLASHC